MPSNHLQIRTLTGVITEIPAQRMKNFLPDWMQPPWKRQSPCLWMAWRHRNAVTSRTFTVCLGPWAPASANCQGKSSNDTQRHVGRLFYPVHDRGGAEAIYTIHTSLVQACPGIQVQTGLIAVHAKNVLVHNTTYKEHTCT
jgi:hypothetical protein